MIIFYLIDTDLYVEPDSNLENEYIKQNIIFFNNVLKDFINKFLVSTAVKIGNFNEEEGLYNKLKLIQKLFGNEIDSFGKLNKFVDSEFKKDIFIIEDFSSSLI